MLGRGFYITKENECIIIILEFQCHIAIYKNFLGA